MAPRSVSTPLDPTIAALLTLGGRPTTETDVPHYKWNMHRGGVTFHTLRRSATEHMIDVCSMSVAPRRSNGMFPTFTHQGDLAEGQTMIATEDEVFQIIQRFMS